MSDMDDDFEPYAGYEELIDDCERNLDSALSSISKLGSTGQHPDVGQAHDHLTEAHAALTGIREEADAETVRATLSRLAGVVDQCNTELMNRAVGLSDEDVPLEDVVLAITRDHEIPMERPMDLTFFGDDYPEGGTGW